LGVLISEVEQLKKGGLGRPFLLSGKYCAWIKGVRSLAAVQQ
jgi:hypothetical protein